MNSRVGRTAGMIALMMGIGAIAPIAAWAQSAPENILPTPPATAPATAAPTATPTVAPSAATPSSALTKPVPEPLPILVFTTQQAQALAKAIEASETEGLVPADYQLKALRSAILAGPGDALNAQASRSMAWLIEDLRDGRTRMADRLGWFVIDTDIDRDPTKAVMERALTSNDIAGTLAALLPTHPDYEALKAMLAAAPKTDKATRNLIRVNMDRWRWMQRDLGQMYLFTNVPEFQLRLTVNNKVVRSYRTIVGKVGKTATPSLAEVVEGVIFNPNWTVPQSIVKGEGLGAQLLANPGRAKRENYKVTKGKDGYITVVQGPGPGNALGLMKLDMPNEHAIFLHDTPNRNLFAQSQRALSHGCVRTERASELGMTMAILGAGLAPEKGAEIITSGQYTKVAMTKTFPVYLTYFTMATDINGKMGKFADLYGRDAPVLASLAKPRAPWDGQRKTSERVVTLDNPL